MINPALFEALNNAFGQIGKIVDEDNPGSFSCPPATTTRMRRISKKYAVADNWGEKYNYNCPVCGDTRGRLVVGHQLGMCVQVGKSIYHFGYTYRCYNESCCLDEYIPQLFRVDRDLDLSEAYTHVKAKPSTFTAFGKPCEDFPGYTIPIISSEVPTYVHEYVVGRGFDPQWLHDKYLIRYAPAGTVWCTGIPDAVSESARKDKTFFEDRLLIPIIQGGQMVSWQARKILGDVKKYKYINGKGHKSGECLYNVDQCLWGPNVVLFEGVTDVWRYGDGAMSMFGKKLSIAQSEILKLLWGWKKWNAKCVVCLDPDAVATGTDDWHVDYLRKKAIFPGGVTSAKLTDGDPADHKISDLRRIIEEAFDKCK